MYKELSPADFITRKNAAPFQNRRSNERAIEWRERCLRLAAEFENFKKRTSRESERRAAEQKEAFIRELLPVVDNLERALNASSSDPAGPLREGVELTLRQLTQVLGKHGFTSRNDLGKPFDPQFHEAASVACEPLREDHSIVEVWQRGWLRGNELFRPAKVVVNDLERIGSAENHENMEKEAFYG